MKIKLKRAIHKLGNAGEVVNVTSDIGSQLVCRGGAVVLSHDSPPQDQMVSKLVAAPPEVEDKPLKIAIVPESTGDSDAPDPEQKTETDQQNTDESSDPKRRQKRTGKS